MSSLSLSLSSSSSILQPAEYHQRMAALVAKLRSRRHWTQTECALRGRMSLADVQVIEDLRPTTTAHWDRRIAALERAFNVPLREMVEQDMRVRVLPFVATANNV